MNRTLQDMIGEAPAFLDALGHVSRIAGLDRPTLVLGERGTGKELFASRLHFLSRRWDKPYVTVNCASLTDTLLESELFGHEAGAFTGATKRHVGRFERADGGTLFLDEIGTATPRIQEKLLRVVEYGEFERVGGDATLEVDVRVIGATNANLRAAASQGDFRADLLDRLAFEVVAVPPLRKRRADIPLLAAHFAQQIMPEVEDMLSDRDGGVDESASLFAGFSPSVINMMMAYVWPGNVRELRSAVQRSVVRWCLSEATGPVDTLIIDPFPPESPAQSDSVDPDKHRPDDDHGTKPELVHDLRAHLNGIEKALVSKALERHRGSQKKAAQSLGLSYDQIRGIIRKYDLT